MEKIKNQPEWFTGVRVPGRFFPKEIKKGSRNRLEGGEYVKCYV
jgi:hypothetical protein